MSENQDTPELTEEEKKKIAQIKALGKKGVTFHTDPEGGVHTNPGDALASKEAIKEKQG